MKSRDFGSLRDTILFSGTSTLENGFNTITLYSLTSAELLKKILGYIFKQLPNSVCYVLQNMRYIVKQILYFPH